jgi:hypothetical protein
MGELMDFKKLIEAAGGVYIGTRGNSVLFRDPQSGNQVLSLYCFALRSTKDVALALKAAREPQPIGFESLERAEAL